jgi:Mg2+ and Co2+ transporter CorA
MLNTSGANVISKIIFTICVLTATATICLVTHGLITNYHHTALILRRRITNQHDRQSQNTKITPAGLMDLIANVTQVVTAMETHAQQLNEELQRMRQKTRQLLWQRQKDALWTAVRKCVFLYGCGKQNYIPRTTGNGANKTVS